MKPSETLTHEDLDDTVEWQRDPVFNWLVPLPDLREEDRQLQLAYFSVLPCPLVHSCMKLCPCVLVLAGVDSVTVVSLLAALCHFLLV